MEQQLKQDLLAELKANHGQLLLHLEEHQFSISPRFLAVKPEEIQTNEDVFEALRTEGYTVLFQRAPLHVESSTGVTSLEHLSNTLSCHSLSSSHFVFSCQQGQRRSTIGLVVCCLLRMQSGLLDFIFGDRSKVSQNQHVSTLPRH